jgi:hypothetical protein
MGEPYFPALETGNHHRRFVGSFAPSGAGISSAAGAIRGTGFTPSHSGTTGIYRVTLTENFKQLVGGSATYQGINADTAPINCQLGTADPANKTVDIICWTESTGTQAKADITASGVARRIHFEFIVAVNDSLGSGAVA